MTANERAHPMIFQPARVGKNLREVGVDFIQIEEKSIKSRWFRGEDDVDLFLWLDDQDRIIKQQISFCGQIVEWNILDGLKTGVVIEQETAEEKPSEVIRFDRVPQADSVLMAIELVRHTESLELVCRKDLQKNLSEGLSHQDWLVATGEATSSKHSVFSRFCSWLKSLG